MRRRIHYMQLSAEAMKVVNATSFYIDERGTARMLPDGTRAFGHAAGVLESVRKERDIRSQIMTEFSKCVSTDAVMAVRYMSGVLREFPSKDVDCQRLERLAFKNICDQFRQSLAKDRKLRRLDRARVKSHPYGESPQRISTLDNNRFDLT